MPQPRQRCCTTRGPTGVKNWQSTLEVSNTSEGRMRATFSAGGGRRGRLRPARMETALALLL